ncbi:MAG: metallophosphatase family protein [Oscillospiraceae bacterium]|jgi:predicted phosphodiesterase|nr:metallophosphatase family protein [Oscillospiraceae bacterium]
MKIAAIADIHGNLTALEAVLADINSRQADEIICLGDIIGKGPDSKAVIDLCRNVCAVVLKGNWEDGLHKAHRAVTQGQAAGVSNRTLWYLNDAGHNRMAYLGALPHSAQRRLGGRLIRFFHAHPLGFSRYYADSPIEKRRELFVPGPDDTGGPADVAVYADIHTAYMQVLSGRVLVNTGSVGNPLDMTQASYCMLESESGADLSVHFYRVPYDIEKAVSAAVKAGVPDLDGYIAELRTAQYFRRT